MKYSHTIILLHGLAMNSKDMKYYRDKFIDTFPEKRSVLLYPMEGKKR